MKSTPQRVEEILHSLRGLAATWGPEMEHYLDYHWRRFILLAQFAEQALQGLGIPEDHLRLLDIGPSFQTNLLARLWPQMHIDTLGFADAKFPPPAQGQHVEYDLNETVETSSWPHIEPYHLAVMAEVIEHLHVAPTHVLRFIDSVMHPGGYLVVTTPNATALSKRLRVLRGQNPHEMIREDRCNPGHFHEYTLSELTQAAQVAGFQVVFRWSGHDSTNRSWKSRVFSGISPLLPGSLRKSIAVVLRKTP